MRKIDLSSVKDCGRIWDCGDYVVASGRYLWVFQKDGRFVSKSQSIRRPGKLHFLPPDKIFVEGGADGQYHYMNLVTGEDIWTTPIDRKRMLPCKQFAVSPDKCYLYDMYNHYAKGKWYVMKFSLKDLFVLKVEVPSCLRITTGMYTDDDGILYALQTQHVSDDEKMAQNGVLRIDWTVETPVFSWERMWQSKWNREKQWNHTEGRYILCEDYSVIDMKTMETFSLLENDVEWNPRFGCGDCVYLPDRGLLMAYHMMYDGNVVIDCKARKRIAQYAPPKLGVEAGYAGCLVGDEYWIGTENGIIRKPFPVFEEMIENGCSPWWSFTIEMEKIRGEQQNNRLK